MASSSDIFHQPWQRAPTKCSYKITKRVLVPQIRGIIRS